MTESADFHSEFKSAGSFDMTVIYHEEDGVWWAESEDFVGWTVAADARDELTERVTESLNTWRPNSRWYWVQTPVETW